MIHQKNRIGFLRDFQITDSGKSFDRNILKNYKSSKPYFLSGGLESANVGDITPFAIDVNSKFEIEPGLKDINKLKILITLLLGLRTK